MRRKRRAAACVIVALGCLHAREGRAAEGLSLRVIYIEASIGLGWRLDELSRRAAEPNLQVRISCEYAFDKTAKVAAALADFGFAPDVIALQECASYFPGPIAEFEQLYRTWVYRIRAAGVTPVVVTTIPPARPRSVWGKSKEFVKARLLKRPRQDDQIFEFNRWLRQLARDERLVLLDLQAALGTSKADPHLAPRYDSGDGIHVNTAAYEVMDGALLRALREVRR